MRRIPSRIWNSIYHTHTYAHRCRPAEDLKRCHRAQRFGVCIIFALAAAGAAILHSWAPHGSILGQNAFQYRANVDTAYAHLVTSSGKRLR